MRIQITNLKDIEESRAIENMPINLRKMWPAVMFPASRIDRVSGRISTLIDSTITRKDIIHSGAPAGAKWATELFKL